MRYLYFLILCFMYTKHVGQTAKIHVHNDYQQAVPFWGAIANNADAIEIDIFLQNNELYVAHEEKEIDKERTLDYIYLQPLQKAIRLQLVAKHKPLQLLIDIKSEAYGTLDVLIKNLKRYSNIIKHKNIQIVISGSRPKVNDYPKYPRFIKFDYQPERFRFLESKRIKNKIALVSFDFKEHTVWNGKGRMVANELDVIKKLISRTHELGKPIRFWATPDSKSAWKALSDLKVDYINTDQPFKCSQYLSTLSKRYYQNTVFSKVYTPTFKHDKKELPVKNIILMIGDGNGLSQISSAVLANGGQLTVTQLKSSGLLKTQSADDFTTDSAASATAIAIGEKTNNRAIGTDVFGNRKENITEFLATKDYLSGCITTDRIYGATPAAFYAHQKDRDAENAIAKELLTSKLSLFIGGGGAMYSSENLKKHNFDIANSIQEIGKSDAKKIGYFLSQGGVPSVLEGRNNALAEVTKNSLQFFKEKKKPFFLMIEGAQIDTYGHHNHVAGVVTETIDFDRAITEALKFADTNDHTLVIVLADHETGGFAIPQGNMKNHTIEGNFISYDHTGTLIPVFAYGPQSYEFEGCYGNEEIYHKILKVLNLKKKSISHNHINKK